MDVDSKVESGINGEPNNVEPQTSTERVKTTVNSRKKKAAETESIETTETEKEVKSSESLNKTRGRQRKDINKMETVENKVDEVQASGEPETENNFESKQQPTTSRKRKTVTEVEAEKEDVEKTETTDKKTSVPIKRSRKKATAEVEIKNAEDEAEPEAAALPERRTLKRKAAEQIKADTKTKKSAKEKPKKSVPVTKAKKQKVLLSIPSIKSISGKVFVMGENDVGQLGFGEEIDVKETPALLELPYSIIEVAAGGMHSVCLTERGEVITFGCNDEGALGRITSNESEEATPSKVEIPEKVIQISTGDSHTAALTESGQVYLWGNFRSGDGPMGLTAEGVKQVKPIKILTGINIVKISSGTEHLVCLSSDGIVYTCGCGENGQLGRFSERMCRDGGRKGRAALLEPSAVPVTGHPNSKAAAVFIEDIWAGSYCTFLKAQETGKIYAFGLNNYNHLGYENERVRFVPKQIASFNSKEWKQISGGQHHTLALDSEGLVYSMGRKDYGRLGLGEDCEEKSSPTLITSLESEKCSSISCGNCVSFALTEEGSIYSWGMGTNHQLGHGNDEDCFVPSLVKGNFLKSWKALNVSGGGQHTLILASTKESAKQDQKK
ncbi:regulator of chromosome condensation [Caerostris extrusa]|uniref:Regulator of chromosome condensation n=1 Tax=Caerostris extrusa TaxID=172846 RepID=A0AAV4QPW3_CAEEX|nr:regulator of chromosome condensation [Caerostris extrusa]